MQYQNLLNSRQVAKEYKAEHLKAIVCTRDSMHCGFGGVSGRWLLVLIVLISASTRVYGIKYPENGFIRGFEELQTDVAKNKGNPRPTIGILAQRCHDCPGKSYIAAGFVKWIESAGARAVPIRYYSSERELHRLFKSVNGLIFPGTHVDLNAGMMSLCRCVHFL